MIARYKQTFVRSNVVMGAYTAGDVVCNAAGDTINFGIARELRQGKITAAKLSVTSDNTTNATFELFFFRENANIPALVDNAAFTMTAAAEEDLIGYTTFTSEVTGTASSQIMWDANTILDIPFTQLESAGDLQGLYGVLTATGAWLPDPNVTFDVTIYIEEDRV